MQIAIDVVFFFLGLAILLKGAAVFTEHASRTARNLGVSEIVIGITLVAFTTSLPELSVSITSMFRGLSGLAVGNVIGSNIANMGLVLGLAALATKDIRAGRGEIKQGYIMLLITVIASLFIIDGLTQLKGWLLISGLFVYVYYLLREKGLRAGVKKRNVRNLPRNVIISAIGAVAVIIGTQLVVMGSINIATYFSISDTIIGLTLVAVGTSLPEIAITITAALKRLEGIALGNIIGSNIFNILMVLGLSAALGTIAVDAAIMIYSIPVMILLTALLVVFMRVENRLSKLDGLALLLIYGFFLYTKFFITY